VALFSQLALQVCEMLDRRTFLSNLSCSLAPFVIAPPVRLQRTATPAPCWLEVAAPFIAQDATLGMQSEIVLTSDTFAGARGYEDGLDATEFEICLYDATGKLLGADGMTKRLTVPAMHVTALPLRELLGRVGKFAGGLKIRLRPQTRAGMHASDLFSSAFVRWQTASSFDNVHANPDPRQWQNTESFYYSMPFPALSEYACVFGLFNPNDQGSAGELVLHDPLGKRLVTQSYELNAHASLFFDLNARSLCNDPLASAKAAISQAKTPGLLAVTNRAGTAKSFGYLMIRQAATQNRPARFSVEHPIHQGVFKPRPAPAPFDDKQQFKARNVLYSPLLFNAKRLGALTLSSRVYVGAGLPLEEAQWLYPFAVDSAGEAVWSGLQDAKLPKVLSSGQTERGALKLGAGQSCQLDFSQLDLPRDFAGGLALAVAPDISHTMMKVEVRVQEWGAFAFTHFRPGLRSARLYQKASLRGGLATDYITSAARLVKIASEIQRDELIAVINIDDQGLEGQPVLELFNPHGLVKRLVLGKVPPFACRHYLLSELVPGATQYETLSLRLTDERATLLMSVIHLDHQRRDLALDHGSDRFSTFQDYTCQ
jgi:hypothetical protein